MTMGRKNRQKAIRIYEILEAEYKEKKTALVYKTPLELLIATILSAQCTDKRVNIVTRDLFNKYKTVKDYAEANPGELEKDIKSTGFYRNKAKNIKSSAQMLIAMFKGRVPCTMEELIKLPGVARKTANIVLFHAFGKNEGIAVDTHVKRVSFRLGLTKERDPVKIEKDLMALLPPNKWGYFSNLLIDHGRNTCGARSPLCDECVLRRLCPTTGR